MRTFYFKFLFLLFLAAGVKAQITPANNKIGLDISTNAQNSSVFNYDSCFTVGYNLGMSQVGLFQKWSAIETSPLNYNMTVFDIANIYYPAVNMPIDLTITPINTNVLEVPSDLTSAAFNSTVMISRFNRLLDSVKAHIPNVTLSSLVIGSEHDVYIGNNTSLWADYTVFYNAVMAHAKVLWPGLKVATELTFDGITSHSTQAQTLNTNSDYIGVSYYPLNSNFTVKSPTVIPVDFSTLVNLFPTKKLCFYQYGYPSSATCNSSNALQTQFITQTFLSWDVYAANIRLIDFTWLHDLDPAQVSALGNYYGITNAAFLEYLRTLGLRTWNGNGADKPALNELRCQAKVRGYNNLNLTGCNLTGVKENNLNDLSVSVFPNPSSSLINIYTGSDEFTGISIYDAAGKKVREIDFLNTVDVSNLDNGIYFLILSGYNIAQKHTTTFVVHRTDR